MLRQKQSPGGVVRKGVEKFTEKHCTKVSFLIKLQAEACKLIKKEILAQVFPCEFCEIFKNTYFEEHLRTAASVCYVSRASPELDTSKVLKLVV